ncbi:hypothetical protein N9N97_01320 [Rickettsiaceae bacterium]|nr:hypothetical protein [Rickettsiaceae bacterium]
MRYVDKLARLDELADGAKWWFDQGNLLEMALLEAEEGEIDNLLIILNLHEESGQEVAAYVQYSMNQFCITKDVIERAKEDEAAPNADSLVALIDLYSNIPDEVQRDAEVFGAGEDIYDIIIEIAQGGGELEVAPEELELEINQYAGQLMDDIMNDGEENLAGDELLDEPMPLADNNQNDEFFPPPLPLIRQRAEISRVFDRDALLDIAPLNPPLLIRQNAYVYDAYNNDMELSGEESAGE